MKRFMTGLTLAVLLAMPASAMAGHGLTIDHPAAPFTTDQTPPAMRAMSGGEGAKWEFVASFPTGNPHTDLDFFTQGGNTFASVGTLGIGPNSGGQSIFQLTEGDKVAPKPVASFPSASCVSNPAEALGLQHDVESTPKGGAILNTDVKSAVRRDTQLLIDATDAPGRCHDQGEALGLAQAPQGGLELIDVSDPENPVAIGLTSHIGEAHTVNVDPKRPHIAYAVTSDSVSVNAEGKRSNDTSGLNLDGFEVVDMSSCMNLPPGTTVQQKRDACRPQVFRYRYPSTEMSLGHTNKGSIYGCHELEVYPDDRLTCASGAALIGLDMSGAFDDRGTPGDFSDDKPRGTPLPCNVRGSTSLAAFSTGAQITDCVVGQGSADLSVAGWTAAGAPSLQGVTWLGSAFHMGREGTGETSPAFDSTEDIDFDHEAELTHSGKFALATDERGGGVAPPGATCSPNTDVKQGNGGVHAYRVDKLLKRRPTSAEDAFSSYARDSKGKKAIYRAPIRTGPQGSTCTAHVFQQIPGQNRIFMGWYSQGTQVLDYEEGPGGTIDIKEAAYFVPQNANQWVSHVFKVEENSDGSFTYWGATGDFNLGNVGRSAVDIYKVTLPPPPAPASLAKGVGKGFEPTSCLARRQRIGSRGIGPIRLGHRPARVLKRAGKPLRRKGNVYRYCVKKGGKRDRVLAVFARKGGVRLVATSAKGHAARGIRPGARVKSLRSSYRRARRIRKGTFLTSRSSRVVFGTKRGRVSFVAVVDRRLVKNTRLLRYYLRKVRLR